jgi:hypothetical protein
VSDVADVLRRIVLDLLPEATVSWEPGAVDVTVRVTVGAEPVCTASVPNGTPARDAALHVANVVQDAAVERRRGAFPECPGHPHAAAARVTGDGVAWTCPSGGRVIRAYAVPDAAVDG